MSGINLRHAKPDELSRVKYITRLAYGVPYKTGTLVTGSHEPKNIRDDFAQKKFFVIVAALDNRIVGAVRYKLVGKSHLYFYRLAVLKSCRKRGIGSALVSAAEKRAVKLNCAIITLDCAREKKLPAYYRKLGYGTDRVKKHLDHHDVYMSKRVNIKNLK